MKTTEVPFQHERFPDSRMSMTIVFLSTETTKICSFFLHSVLTHEVNIVLVIFHQDDGLQLFTCLAYSTKQVDLIITNM